MFQSYLELGFEHILDPNGYDHVLFIIALAIVYQLKDWKKVAILITAFTISHSVTLALSALDLISIDADLVEALIPITIILTCLFNIFFALKDKEVKGNYALAAVFGLIHGLGFSNYFKAIIGQEESVVFPLFAFNLGVELGQLVIMIIVLLVSYGLNKILDHKYVKIAVSGIIVLWTTYLMIG